MVNSINSEKASWKPNSKFEMFWRSKIDWDGQGNWGPTGSPLLESAVKAPWTHLVKPEETESNTRITCSKTVASQRISLLPSVAMAARTMCACFDPDGSRFSLSSNEWSDESINQSIESASNSQPTKEAGTYFHRTTSTSTCMYVPSMKGHRTQHCSRSWCSSELWDAHMSRLAHLYEECMTCIINANNSNFYNW